MALRSIGISCMLAVAWLSTSQVARAECVRVSGKEMAKRVMEEQHYELVFSGTVVAVTRTAELGYRATFDVDRVWKGSVTKRFDLYVWELAPEVPRFETGHQYIALARKLVAPQERKGAGLDKTDLIAFTPVQCSDPDSLAPDIARELGPGRAPLSRAH